MVVDEIIFLLYQKSLARWPVFWEKICNDDGVVVEDLFLIFMLEPPHNLHFGVTRLLKTCFALFFF